MPVGLFQSGGGGSGASGYTPGVNAQSFGVTGNGYIRFDALAYYFTLSQVSVSGGQATYTGTITGGGSNAFAGYSFKVTGFSNSGNNVIITVVSSTTTTLVCTSSTQVNETHAGNAGSNTIDCALATFNTQATVGQIVFATNLTSAGFSYVSAISVPQGTITAINSNTQIVVSQYASGNTSSNSVCLVWGDDQSTALTNAWNAIMSDGGYNGGMLALPAANPNGDGPAVILVQSAQLNGNNANVNIGTGGCRKGYGAFGGGKHATYIVPTPNFNFATAYNNVCFLNVPNGGLFHDFSIFGGGVSNPGSGLSSIIGAQLNDSAGDNAYMWNMGFFAWGANGTNGIGVGLKILGGEQVLYNIDCDMFGQIACECAAGSNLGTVVLSQCWFWDSASMGLYVAGGAANPVYTYGCQIGNCTVGVSVYGSGIWHDFGSQIGLPTVSFGTVSGGCSVGIGLNYIAGAFGLTGVGTAYLTGTVIDSPVGANGSMLYLGSASCLAQLQGVYLKNESGSTHYLIKNAGSIVDAGGNTFLANGGTLYSGSGSVFGALSITGTAQTSGNVALTSGWGSGATVTAVSGNTRRQQFTITVGTSPSASPVVTVTFPTPFLIAPICYAYVVGGTQPNSNITTGAVSTTTAAFTWNGTPTAADTLVIVVEADLP